MLLSVADSSYLARDAHQFDFHPSVAPVQDFNRVRHKILKNAALNFRTAIISDTHLGRDAANAEFLLEFLTHINCEKMIIAGDGIDGWDLEAGRQKAFPEMHARCLDAVNAMAAQGTEVIDLRGNHDEKKARSRYGLMNNVIDFRSRDGKLSAPIRFGKSHIHHDAKGRKLLVLHGDVFDNWQKNSRLKKIAEKADFMYEPIVRCSNAFRKAVMDFTGLDISVVAPLKTGTKWLVGAVKNFEQAVARDSIRERFDGVVCGHIHHAQINEQENFVYMNSGDWVESCRCLVETHEGEWKILVWSAERKKLGLGKLPKESDDNLFARYRGITERQIGLIARVWPGCDRAEIVARRREEKSSNAHKQSVTEPSTSSRHIYFPQPVLEGI